MTKEYVPQNLTGWRLQCLQVLVEMHKETPVCPTHETGQRIDTECVSASLLKTENTASENCYQLHCRGFCVVFFFSLVGLNNNILFYLVSPAAPVWGLLPGA